MVGHTSTGGRSCTAEVVRGLWTSAVAAAVASLWLHVAAVVFAVDLTAASPTSAAAGASAAVVAAAVVAVAPSCSQHRPAPLRFVVPFDCSWTYRPPPYSWCQACRGRHRADLCHPPTHTCQHMAQCQPHHTCQHMVQCQSHNAPVNRCHRVSHISHLSVYVTVSHTHT